MAASGETKKRKVLRCGFTRIANEVDALLKQEQPARDVIEVSWACLKEKFEELRICENEVFAALLDGSTEEQLVAEMECCDSYNKRYVELRLACEKFLSSKHIDEDSIRSEHVRCDDADDAHNKRKFKLPRIEFKQYDGDIRGWLSFWSQFKKVHEDTDIVDSDKIEYLIQSTVPGSRARKIVESFPVIGENYVKIIDCLKARFGRDELQIEVYVRELLKLVLNNAMAKQKLDISVLYDQIETQLRALDTLGISSDKYSALLFPLIESCLPQELLRIWQRSSLGKFGGSVDQGSSSSLSTDSTLETRLRNLLEFLRCEVENESRINLANESFGLTENIPGAMLKVEQNKKRVPHLSTAAGLINTDVTKCIFCSGTHNSESCFKAQKMSLDEKRDMLRRSNACFCCLKVGHPARKCRTRLKCMLCGKSHVLMMCPDVASKGKQGQKIQEEPVEKDQTLTNQTGTHVFLQTLLVNLRGNNGSRTVRALFDSGSQRSYILKSTASSLGLKPKRAEKIVHCLFGGLEEEKTHHCYDITIEKGNYVRSFEVLDQPYICSEVLPIFYGPWIPELKGMKIEVSDVKGQGPIELLLGADISGMLYTGRRQRLQCGLVAIETHIGWTLEGKVPSQNGRSSHTMTVMSLLVQPTITDLWQLDVLGIQEPSEKKSRAEMALAAKELFQQTVTIDAEGRYEVRLPWIEEHPPLPTNYNTAKKRLETTMRKLTKDNLFQCYDEIFREWQDTNIIEEVKDNVDNGHFLPHRPVLKEGSTTAVRPVFDASAHEKDKPSLNQCLEKGMNLIETIPASLLRFREFSIGVVSDIKKAFLQISVNQRDRDFLKFLWVDENGEQIVYQHRRVVFGINCSPFLLGATIEQHLRKCLESCEIEGAAYTREVIEKLSKSFYVDNCCTSLPDPESLNRFIKESVSAMTEGQFDLRGWEFSGNTDRYEHNISVLGVKWFPKDDVLTINPDLLIFNKDEVVTKRSLLSMAQKVFDPIGFTCPTTLLPKLWLQDLWAKKVTWDAPLSDEVGIPFKNWVSDLPHICEVKLPRWIHTGGEKSGNISIHTFVDASKDAYAAAVFCRVQKDGEVLVHLVAAKSRVAPLRRLTIPRLELIAANIGARLYSSVRENLESNVESYFWSDSSTVLAWIKGKDEWKPFVSNRVAEIRRYTEPGSWRHVPGYLNPADLPSRGCSPRKLLESRWWEGPTWLYEDSELWPPQEINVIDETEVTSERKKKLVCSLISLESSDTYHLMHFSSFIKTVRMVAWMFRFISNAKKQARKQEGELSVEEVGRAETFIFKVVQNESFLEEKLKGLDPFCDEQGVIRIKSRVCNRPDTDSFRFPIVLPGSHPIVQRLIFHHHVHSCHVGVQGLLSNLREHFWIIGGRRTVRSVVSKCVICKRHNVKSFTADSPPLPLDRVRDAAVFEVVGIDFAGPLYLKSGDKAWVCLFTCAVYRAVHLELVTSLSTAGFVQVLRRFVARRGRPAVVYSDNGTNFVGTENAFAKIDWQEIQKYSSVTRIAWKFNPPSAAWWGGFWERLIGLLKQLLRRVLGRASLNYEELFTLICECEATVNSRPLTYIGEDSTELVALTPMMFLSEQKETGAPDLNVIDRDYLCRRMRYKQRLRDDLRRRFRNEYLGLLKGSVRARKSNPVTIGQVVIIGSDNEKRIDWPLGRIVEVVPGKDGQIRVVKVNTSKGQVIRPIQRLFPIEELEFIDTEHLEEEEQAVVPPSVVQSTSCHEEADILPSSSKAVEKPTRSGRVPRPPRRYL